LVIGTVSVYRLYHDPAKWILTVRSFHHDAEVQHFHSYVTVEGATGYVTENSTDAGGGDILSGVSSVPSTGDLPKYPENAPSGALPGGAYVGDAPVQEEAIQAIDKLMPYVRSYPDWYGGAYIDGSGTLVVCLVESEDPGDKSLELKVLDWTDNGKVAFTDVKYSLAHLNELMDKLNQLPETDPTCGDVMASWGVNEETNRIELTLTEVNDHILSVLAELDPEDDAIYVQVGQRFSVTEDTENPALIPVQPGGDVSHLPSEDDAIAYEPMDDMDGAYYSTED